MPVSCFCYLFAAVGLCRRLLGRRALVLGDVDPLEAARYSRFRLFRPFIRVIRELWFIHAHRLRLDGFFIVILPECDRPFLGLGEELCEERLSPSSSPLPPHSLCCL